MKPIKTIGDLADLVGDLIREEVANQRREIREAALENARRRDKAGFGDERVELHETLWFDSDAEAVAHNVVRRLLELNLIRLPEEGR